MKICFGLDFIFVNWIRFEPAWAQVDDTNKKVHAEEMEIASLTEKQMRRTSTFHRKIVDNFLDIEADARRAGGRISKFPTAKTGRWYLTNTI